ncbi:MAG: SMC-Scp complex subunit ScpB [Candidatus Jorgensenbacteria bacterium]
MNEQNPQKLAELEAFLFHYGEAVEIKKIAKILKLKENEVADLVNFLENNLKETAGRGLTLLRQESRVQLVTKPEFENINKELIKEEFREELSPASLETLSIIAYLGPVSRATVDFVRGVNSSFILRSLLVRGLVEREPNPERRNVYDYRVSFDFLRHIGLGRQEDLPEYDKYKDIIQKFTLSGETQENQNPAQ